MTNRFDQRAEAQRVENLANRAGNDWRDRPASYAADAEKLSQEVSTLAQHGLLEGVVAQMRNDSAYWGVKGCAPKVWQVDRGNDGEITGIEFLSWNSNWDNQSYANVTLNNRNVK